MACQTAQKQRKYAHVNDNQYLWNNKTNISSNLMGVLKPSEKMQSSEMTKFQQNKNTCSQKKQFNIFNRRWFCNDFARVHPHCRPAAAQPVTSDQPDWIPIDRGSINEHRSSLRLRGQSTQHILQNECLPLKIGSVETSNLDQWELSGDDCRKTKLALKTNFYGPFL